MSDLNVNVDDIKEPEVPAPGIYNGVTIEALDFALINRDGDNVEDNHKRDKNGDRYLQGRFKIHEGEFAGSVVFANYINPSSVTFKKLCESAGRTGQISSTDDLIGLPLRGIKVENELYEDKIKATIKEFI